MNLLLHGLPDARIFKGDTIRDPKILEEDGSLMLFDRVIANPPFSLEEWGRETAEKDPHGRFRFGIPPKSKGDLAFVQHMVAALNRSGSMAVVMPHGILFREGTEGEIRRKLVEEDMIEAVIGLPPNLFYGTGIPAAILILSRSKLAEKVGKVLLIDASREYQENSNQNYLRDEDVQRISSVVRRSSIIESYSKSVSQKEIRESGYNLNLGRYIDAPSSAPPIQISAAIEALRSAEKAREDARNEMVRRLRELGYEF
jgi:type I restriction enzyme M protein